MTRSRWISHVLKPVLYLAATLPLVWIGIALAHDLVDGDQVKFIQHVTGKTALVSLFLTLSITPLRRLTGMSELVRVRRLVGLTAFWYASLHLLSYLVFDQALSPPDIAEDIAEHPWVLVGFASFLMLVPLAVTSTRGWVRRLGGKRWQRLHRLVYPAAVGGVLHFLWLVKKDVRDPLYFAVILGVILAARVWLSSRREAPRGVPHRVPLAATPRASTFPVKDEDVP